MTRAPMDTTVADLQINDRIHLPDGTCGTVAATVANLQPDSDGCVAVPVMTVGDPFGRHRLPLDAVVTLQRPTAGPCRGDHDWDDVAVGDRVTGRECTVCGKLEGSTSAPVSPYGPAPSYLRGRRRDPLRGLVDRP